MVDEPDENHLQGEKKKPKKPTTSPPPPPTATATSNHNNHHTTTTTSNLGLTTQEALKVLCDEIEEVVKSYERNLHNER